MKLSSVGVKNSCGGTAIACSSVLNAVNASQIKGNTTSSVIPHAKKVRTASARAFMSVEVLADKPDQEHRGDVGQHDGEERPRRGDADVEVHERLLEDQERDVGALVARPAASRRE